MAKILPPPQPPAKPAPMGTAGVQKPSGPIVYAVESGVNVFGLTFWLLVLFAVVVATLVAAFR